MQARAATAGILKNFRSGTRSLSSVTMGSGYWSSAWRSSRKAGGLAAAPARLGDARARHISLASWAEVERLVFLGGSGQGEGYRGGSILRLSTNSLAVGWNVGASAGISAGGTSLERSPSVETWVRRGGLMKVTGDPSGGRSLPQHKGIGFGRHVQRGTELALICGHAVGRDALRDKARAWLVRPGLDEDARGDVVQVRERHDVGRRAPAVVHLGEAQPGPVGDEQRPVVGGDLVRPLLPFLDDLDDVGHGGRGHLTGRGGDAHDVVAVAVESRAPGREARVEERPRVHGEGEMDGGFLVEARGACPALPRLGDEHLERRAPGPARGRRELGLEVVDVVRGDVDGEVLEPLGAGGLREAAHERAGRVRDGVAAPRRGHRDAARPARQLPHRAHELRRPWPVRHRSRTQYLDEQDELALFLVGGLGARVGEQLVLVDGERVLQIVDVLQPTPDGGLDEPDPTVAAVHLQLAGIGHGEAAGQRVVVDKRPRQGPLHGPGGGIPFPGHVGLEHVQRLDESHLGRVAVEPRQAERALRRRPRRRDQALREPLYGHGLGRRRRRHVERAERDSGGAPFGGLA
ncbi:hypothetical protein BRADI_2g33977v3 [Brachypodium distachyon]|uniref:Uncharacterized protein n=1 Tax=Brachypodium distachyon TaxID=15368 RepID=A0A2K2DBQ5_BRADI|nr:hypothetical protein BRADI_2g33977v3 [Brachypodium distachyon]